MPAFKIQKAAAYRLRDIYLYSEKHWSKLQADKYLDSLFECFESIAGGAVISKPVPAEFGVQGFFARYEKHVIYWKHLSDGSVGIVTVLHERMHQIERFKDDFSIANQR